MTIRLKDSGKITNRSGERVATDKHASTNRGGFFFIQGVYFVSVFGGSADDDVAKNRNWNTFEDIFTRDAFKNPVVATVVPPNSPRDETRELQHCFRQSLIVEFPRNGPGDVLV